MDKFPPFAGKVSLYLNRNAMYYTVPGVVTDKDDSYRNVGGSIDLDNLISIQKETGGEGDTEA